LTDLLCLIIVAEKQKRVCRKDKLSFVARIPSAASSFWNRLATSRWLLSAYAPAINLSTLKLYFIVLMFANLWISLFATQFLESIVAVNINYHVNGSTTAPLYVQDSRTTKDWMRRSCDGLTGCKIQC